MTVAALPATISYIEDGASTSFPVPFRFKRSADLLVERLIGGQALPLRLGTDYAVSGGETDSGGTLVRTTASNGATLRISRRTARAQPMKYTTGDRFPAVSHEEALDRAILITQELDADLGDIGARALTVPPGEILPPLPARNLRIGGNKKLLAIDPITGNVAVEEAGTSFKGDPGGNAMAIGPFTSAGQLRIEAGYDLVQTSGYDTPGVGAARYSYDPVVDTVYVAANPRTSFVSANSRGFRIAEGEIAMAAVGAKEDDGVTSDAEALQAAVNVSGRREIVSAAQARVRTAKYVDMFRQQGFPYYASAIVTRNDVSLGVGTLHVKGRGVAGPTNAEFMFATPRYSVAGTRVGFSALGTTFDMSDDGNTASTNQRAMHLTCTDNIRLIGTMARNSGDRRGYVGHFDNVRNVIVAGHMHDKVTGGLNFRYVSGAVIAASLFSNFSEAIDFDGIAETVVISGVAFRSVLNVNQCIDLNSTTNAVVGTVAVSDVGNIYTINYKDTTQQTYDDFLSGAPATIKTPARNIVVSGVVAVRAANAGSSAASINIGTDFATNYPEGAVNGLILANHILDTCGYVLVQGAEKLNMSNWLLRNITSPVSSSFGAISLRPDTFADSTFFPVEGTLTNIEVDGCNRSALVTSSARRLDIDGFRALNTDTSASGDRAVNISNVPSGARYTVERLAVAGDVAITAPADAQIVWGKRSRITGSLFLSNAAHRALLGETETIQAGDIAATGTRSFRFMPNRKCKVVYGYYSCSAAVPADATNSRTLTVRSFIGGVATAVAAANPNTSLGWPANTRLDFNIPITRVLDLNPGDFLDATLTHSGTGQAISTLTLCFEVIYL